MRNRRARREAWYGLRVAFTTAASRAAHKIVLRAMAAYYHRTVAAGGMHVASTWHGVAQMALALVRQHVALAMAKRRHPWHADAKIYVHDRVYMAAVPMA